MIRDKLISDREKYIAEKERIHIDYKYTLNHELPPVYYMYQGIINYIDYLLEKIDKEDKIKDIPLIPDDELWYISGNKGIIEDAYTYSKISRDNAINHNFKVLKEKINQVIEAINNES